MNERWRDGERREREQRRKEERKKGKEVRGDCTFEGEKKRREADLSQATTIASPGVSSASVFKDDVKVSLAR